MFVLFMMQELDVQLSFLPTASSLGSLLIIAKMILDFAQQMGFSDIVVLTHEDGANSDEGQERVGSLSAVEVFQWTDPQQITYFSLPAVHLQPCEIT